MMDMLGMDMGGGGMDMASEGLFTSVNKKVAHGYWYCIAAVTGLFALTRLSSWLQRHHRSRRRRQDLYCIPSRPSSLPSKAYATATAIFRELSYAQPVYFTGRISKYFTPLPTGQWLLLAVYWTVLLIMLWSNTIIQPSDPMYGYKWEKVGFRAGWVSMSQIPFIYLLSMKFSPLTAVTGISYERINWLHRWAARTVFLTSIVHWSFFLHEWWLADFIAVQIEMMPMVRYGFGAFGTIAWMVLSGFGIFRAMSYEIFVAQHIAAAAVLLWLLFMHVPAYARYNVWLSVAFIAFDWGMRILWNTVRNTHLLSRAGLRAPGYVVQLEPLPGDMARLTIPHTDFNWRAGQHAYLSIPRLRPFELHPFTIANAPLARGETHTRPLTMLIKARSGFSKTLHQAAVRGALNHRTYRAFLSGPWGMPPDLQTYDTVVLIACSSGASFTTPLLEALMHTPACVRKVQFHWIVREEEHFAWFAETLTALVRKAQAGEVGLHVTLHITTNDPASINEAQHPEQATSHSTAIEAKPPSEQSSSNASLSSSAIADEKAPLSGPHHNFQSHEPSSLKLLRTGRPRVDSLICPAVEAAFGETAVVVCGGQAITAQARTFVAALSDERAVHKGTGAQGIYLFTETYGW